jgi:DNA-binding response OmpR family regulator
MEETEADVVLAAQDLPPAGARSLAEAMHSGGKRIPVLALTAEGSEGERSEGAEIDDCQKKCDGEAVLAALARLAGQKPLVRM